MIRTLATAVTLAALALPVVAQDASADDIVASVVNGSVQVNQGEQFLPLQAGQVLHAGDRVMAMRDGSATIRFEDGCDLTVESETMIVVPDTSTCAGGVVAVQAVAPGSAGAVGSTAYTGGAAAGGIDGTGFAIVAGVAAVGNAILFNEDENETVSP